jgi:undecaprenyl-diphosphatase
MTMPTRSHAKKSYWGFLQHLERKEIHWLLTGLGICLLLFAFVSLAGEVTEGDTQALDAHVLQALRNASDPSRPIGPPWVEYSMLDLTSLGSPTVLGLFVCAVTGFLLLQGLRRSALVVVATSASGEIVNAVMKHYFMRARPTIVPHLRDAFSPSFPSGHAMESAIIYLTLGTMLMRIAERRVTKMYCLVVATLLTLLVGISRVILGVHYPTDVIGGWIIGFMWASLCWLAAQRFEPVTKVKAKASEQMHAATK